MEIKKGHSSKGVILTALIANLFIAVLKLVVAAITGSSAMLAEGIHSIADTLNQVFLLVGIKKGEKKPDRLHPFGFSGELYFWSFIVAIILFTGGGVFSIYEGIHKVLHPEAITSVTLAYGVLLFSIAAEGVAFYKASKQVNRERQGMSVFQYLRATKKSELIVVFLEDLAAMTGLTVALLLIFLQQVTGILVFDGIASILIGVLLCVVAVFLGNEIRSLLIGESADPKAMKKVAAIFEKEESINRLVKLKSLQLGPHDILVAADVEFNHRLTSVEISNLIDGIEKDIRQTFPDIKKIFIEPDIYKGK